LEKNSFRETSSRNRASNMKREERKHGRKAERRKDGTDEKRGKEEKGGKVAKLGKPGERCRKKVVERREKVWKDMKR
jgi:hypothetical protein